MKNKKLSKSEKFATTFLIVSVVSFISGTVLLSASDGKIFAVRYPLVFFLLIMLAGVSMIISCVLFYKSMIMKERKRRYLSLTCLCKNCGKRIKKSDEFCPYCGNKNDAKEELKNGIEEK